MTNPITKRIELSDGREITLETGKLAKQADGSVTLRVGETFLLATVTAAKDASPGVDFMPLQVEYREKYASAGRFPGGFLKREGRPSDSEILTSRLIDRVLRPLFPEDYHADVFVNVILFSSDGKEMPDALAALAASAALAVSDIPFNGPISEVRVARIDGKLVVNPQFDDLAKADMDLMVGATINDIMMVEGEMSEVSEADMLEAIKFAHEEIKKQCQAQIELSEMAGTTVKREYSHEENDEDLKKQVWDDCYAPAYEAASSQNPNKHERLAAFENVLAKFLETIPEEELEEKSPLIKRYYHEVEKEAMRRSILDEGKRLDGRETTEIRPIWSEVDFIPGPHGSALFTRGETQSLTTVTLGTKLDEKMVDDALVKGHDRFLLHYNFPPFSTGEARPQRGTGRREIGHGNLAQRALKGMIPDSCPYTVRVVSDVLESNGSSSMAAVCSGSMALMDAGIQMKKPVSGIAMGLISDGDRHAVLSDILGDEDHLGDMDFKVTGTKDGITACQMDIKIDGLRYDIMEQALEQAREGRLHILGKLTETLAKPNETVKRHAPKILKMTIAKEFIGAVIGPGGKNIQALQAETGTTVVINEEGDLGIIEILGVSPEGMDKAVASIQNTIFAPVEGETYVVRVVKMLDFGAVVEFVPGKETLLHVSELDWKRVENVTDVVNLGDALEVKYLGIGPKTKKPKVSRKALLPRPPREDKK